MLKWGRIGQIGALELVLGEKRHCTIVSAYPLQQGPRRPKLA
jgi:hypothetical protein